MDDFEDNPKCPDIRAIARGSREQKRKIESLTLSHRSFVVRLGAVSGDWLSGRALASHARGHWFEPSIAHRNQII